MRVAISCGEHMINFERLSSIEKKSVLKKIKETGNYNNITYKGKKIIFGETVVLGFVCTNNKCNAFHKFNIHPSSLRYVVDRHPCSRCNSDSYLKFIMEDKFEKNIGRYLNKGGTLLEYFIDEKTEETMDEY